MLSSPDPCKKWTFSTRKANALRQKKNSILDDFQAYGIEPNAGLEPATARELVVALGIEELMFRTLEVCVSLAIRATRSTD